VKSRLGLLLLLSLALAAGCAKQPAAVPAASTQPAAKAPKVPLAAQPTKPTAGAKRIAVTIDDGPALTYSVKAMDEAEKYGGHVTFFVTGQRLGPDPQMIRLMQKRGHLIGNHTFNHVNLTTLPDEKIRAQLGQTNDLIVAQGGAKPTFFRPPYGGHNARVDGVAAALGLRPVMWDIDPEDWNQKNTGAHTVSYILSHAQPNKIVLIHQVHNTYLVLDQIFAGLHRQGFTVVRVDQLPKYAAAPPPPGRVP
jgi:peptidoglycan/xylan/chitin deacetylase (PgdA/CDA1 family)